MVVTVADLAIELRLPDTLDAQQTSVLTRLIGVGEAFVDLLISGAPEPIQEQVIIRLGAYLYEQPTSGRRDSYSNSWVNSGAGALASRWLTQTIAGEAVLAPSTGGVGTGGIGEAAASALIQLWAREGNSDPIPLDKLTLAGGAATDQTARNAAAAVAAALQQALVGLSISGNTLSASRQGGGTAASVIIPTGMAVADGVIVSAAVNVGAESVTVTTSTGNTVVWDLTAILDPVRTLITNAQTAADAAQTAITDHEAAHPSGLPTGTSQQRELKWNPTTSAWEAVSDVTTVYYGAVAVGDYTHVASALAAGLNTAGIQIATTSFLLYKGRNTLRNDHMAALWAGISQAPTVFVLAPAHTDWIPNFTCSVRSGALALTVADDFVAINGTKYDIALAVHPGMEADVGSVTFRYTAPGAVYAITDPSQP